MQVSAGALQQDDKMLSPGAQSWGLIHIMDKIVSGSIRCAALIRAQGDSDYFSEKSVQSFTRGTADA